MTPTEYIALAQIAALVSIAVFMFIVRWHSIQRQKQIESAITNLITQFHAMKTQGSAQSESELKKIIESISNRPGRLSEREFDVLQIARRLLENPEDFFAKAPSHGQGKSTRTIGEARSHPPAAEEFQTMLRITAGR